MKKILITGGPVHACLDPVKMITNRFKGGMMAQLAEQLGEVADVIYLTSKGNKEPKTSAYGVCKICGPEARVKVVYHNGFDDYRSKVTELAKDVDAVVLGAAVVNLIPVAYYKGIDHVNSQDGISMPLPDKFPSHNYKPGDKIIMEWTIAPRVIDEVKTAMRRNAHLFGFKLLSGQSHSELIRAAHEVLLESKATCVFANDASTKDSLMTKYAVMKDRSVHEMQLKDMARFINNLMDNEYYQTNMITMMANEDIMKDYDIASGAVGKLIREYKSEFTEVEGGHIFGTVAVRVNDGNSFVTTARGKKELDGRVWVIEVNHDKLTIMAGNKATLNAPLLHWIFSQYSQVHSIVHTHVIPPSEGEYKMPVYPYSPPGTKRDSIRGLPCKSFSIDGHGCFLLMDKNGEVIR